VGTGGSFGRSGGFGRDGKLNLGKLKLMVGIGRLSFGKGGSVGRSGKLGSDGRLNVGKLKLTVGIGSESVGSGGSLHLLTLFSLRLTTQVRSAVEGVDHLGLLG
jgi:hypothetical protein